MGEGKKNALPGPGTGNHKGRDDRATNVQRVEQAVRGKMWSNQRKRGACRTETFRQGRPAKP